MYPNVADNYHNITNLKFELKDYSTLIDDVNNAINKFKNNNALFYFKRGIIIYF